MKIEVVWENQLVEVGAEHEHDMDGCKSSLAILLKVARGIPVSFLLVLMRGLAWMASLTTWMKSDISYVI